MRRTLVTLMLVTAAAGAAVLADEYLGLVGAQRGQPYGDNVEYDGRLTFVRIRYDVGYGGFSRRGSRGELPWAHDYPTADVHMMKILKELSLVNPRVDGSNVLTFDDPALFDNPIAYVSEPGFWTMSDAEAKGLRDYMLKGGFVIFDDFREGDWYNLEDQMKRVMPELRFVPLDQNATIFNSFFEIRNFSFGYYGKETYYGLFENNDQTKRLMAIAGHNQDLGEYWEFSDTGIVPVDLSNEAYKFGVNYFIYGLIH